MSNNRNPYNGLKGRLNVTGENINRIRVQQNLSAQALSDALLKDFSKYVKKEKN